MTRTVLFLSLFCAAGAALFAVLIIRFLKKKPLSAENYPGFSLFPGKEAVRGWFSSPDTEEAARWRSFLRLFAGAAPFAAGLLCLAAFRIRGAAFLRSVCLWAPAPALLLQWLELLAASRSLKKQKGEKLLSVLIPVKWLPLALWTASLFVQLLLMGFEM